VWEFDSERRHGNNGAKVEFHAFEPLDDGQWMIAESCPARIMEIVWHLKQNDLSGIKLAWVTTLEVLVGATKGWAVVA